MLEEVNRRGLEVQSLDIDLIYSDNFFFFSRFDEK